MNWLKFKWGDDYTDNLFEYHQDKIFEIDFINLDLQGDDPLNESIKLIHSITKNYPEPYQLFVSGGIDSQSMLYAWKKSNIPFNAYAFVYNNHFNKHDLTTLGTFCQGLDIKINFIDVDFFSFLKKDLINYSKAYICNSPQITFHMRFAEIISKGTKIYSGDAMGSLDYTILGLKRFALLNDPNIIPFFFMESPIVAGAFINKIKSVFTDPIYQRFFKGNTYLTKSYAYNHSGFSILPTKKFSGFEQYKLYFDNLGHLVPPLNRLKFGNFKSKRNFDLLYRYPLFEINTYNDHHVPINHPFQIGIPQ